MSVTRARVLDRTRERFIWFSRAPREVRAASDTKNFFEDSFLPLPFHGHQRYSFVVSRHRTPTRWNERQVSPSESMRGDPSCLDRGVDAALGGVEREDVVVVVNVQRGVLSGSGIPE